MSEYEKPLPVAITTAALLGRRKRTRNCGPSAARIAAGCAGRRRRLPAMPRWDHAWEKLREPGTVMSYRDVHRSGAVGFAEECLT